MFEICCSLNSQHRHCKNPRTNLCIKTLLFDHHCGHQNGPHEPSPATNSLMAMILKGEASNHLFLIGYVELQVDLKKGRDEIANIHSCKERILFKCI